MRFLLLQWTWGSPHSGNDIIATQHRCTLYLLYYSSTVWVFVTVLDVNDNPPVFEEPSYTTDIPEVVAFYTHQTHTLTSLPPHSPLSSSPGDISQ